MSNLHLKYIIITVANMSILKNRKVRNAASSYVFNSIIYFYLPHIFFADVCICEYIRKCFIQDKEH